MADIVNEETTEKDDTISEEIASEEANTTEDENQTDSLAESALEDSESPEGKEVEEDDKAESKTDNDSGEKDEDDKDYSDAGEEDEEGDEKYQELNSKYLRLYAEFDNFRRRTAKETMEIMKNANADLVGKLLPTLENFERAFSTEQKGESVEDFEKGFKMIYNNLKDTLEETGLEEINPEGEEFDPNFHEAVMQQPHDVVEEDHVVQVYQKGYKFNSKILKHAMVIVSKGKE